MAIALSQLRVEATLDASQYIDAAAKKAAADAAMVKNTRDPQHGLGH
jgi:hypothetical protein